MNAIIRAAIQRWQITLVVFLALTALGLSAFLTIPRSVDPHFPSPFILIIATVPGAEPADMESTIAKPIEDVVQGLDGIVKVQLPLMLGTNSKMSTSLPEPMLAGSV